MQHLHLGHRCLLLGRIVVWRSEAEFVPLEGLAGICSWLPRNISKGSDVLRHIATYPVQQHSHTTPEPCHNYLGSQFHSSIGIQGTFVHLGLHRWPQKCSRAGPCLGLLGRRPCTPMRGRRRDRLAKMRSLSEQRVLQTSHRPAWGRV